MPTSRHRRKGVTRPRVRHERVVDPDCAACTDPDYSPEREWQRTFDAIGRDGWYAQSVGGDRAHAPYTYTAGLSLRGHPELVVAGMATQAAYVELATWVDAVLAGLSLPGMDELRKACGCVTRFVPVGRGAVDLGVADVVLGGAVEAIQCVWSVGDRYPGQPDYPAIAHRQPLYGPAWWLSGR